RRRKSVQLARPRTPAGRRGRHARLPGDPGAGAAVLTRIHRYQPRRRRAVRLHQPDDPLPMTALTPAPDSAVLAADEIRTPWSEFWRKFRRQKTGVVAGVFVILLVVIAVAAPWIAPFDAENYFDYDQLNAPPSLVHWFGV